MPKDSGYEYEMNGKRCAVLCVVLVSLSLSHFVCTKVCVQNHCKIYIIGPVVAASENLSSSSMAC